MKRRAGDHPPHRVASMVAAGLQPANNIWGKDNTTERVISRANRAVERANCAVSREGDTEAWRLYTAPVGALQRWCQSFDNGSEPIAGRAGLTASRWAP